jgi:Cyclin, N-terminal domain
MSDPSASALQAQELGVKKEEYETISASLLPGSHLSPADTATAASTTTTNNNNAMKTTTTNAPDDLSKPPPLVTGFSSSAATPARETNPPIVIRSVTPGLSNASGPPPAKTAAALAVTTAATTTPALTISAAPTTTSNAVIIPPKQRLYRSAETHGNKNKWATREIAALGFLLGIPLEAEASIVKQGWLLQQEQLREKNNKDFSHTINSSSIMDESGRGADSDSNYAAAGTAATAAAAKGHWWEKHLQGEDVQAAAAALAAASPRGGGVGVDTRPKGGTTYETELERPPSARASTAATQTAATAFNYAPPGRRLEGDEAVRVQIPLTTRTLTKQRYIARQAALRQWELQTAHGLTTTTTTTATMGEKTSQNNNNHSNTAAGGANISKSVPSTPGTTTTSSSISLTSVAATSAAATAATTTTTTGTTTSTTTTRTIPPLLDGRLFFSAGGSYPVSVFSVIRYEPRKEELLRRRQKLEAMGGGGSQFVMPTRDWRGISYRSLLPRLDNNSSSKKKTHHHRHDRHHHHHGRHRRPKNFNRFLRSSQNEDDDDPIVALGDDGVNASRHSKHSNRSDENDNDSSTAGSDSSSLSDDSDDDVVYAPGILDDPNMVLGRHRTVMIGDRVTGPMVSSTIQFVKPALLKAELNKQFRERFDGWEPPRAARKYIGARVVDGAYKLMDPKEQTDDYQHDTTTSSALAMDDNLSSRNRQGETPNGGGTTAAASSAPPLSKEKQLRMPPSLTLSKIRSLKRQALAACVQARLEIGTVALACVYFERLCLDCRVDKSNRRLSFAACLLLAAKLNEPNIGLVMKNTADGGAATANSNNNNNGSNDNMSTRLQSLIRPNRRSSIMFASLLEFFTEDWNLALPVLFSAVSCSTLEGSLDASQR